MSHIAIKLNGVYLATGENTEIDIEDANPYFNDQSETMSLPFTVPLDGNRAAFGNVECIENDDNLRSIENMRMDVEVDGILLRSGKAGSIEDQSLVDSVTLQMISAVYSLEDYLDGVRCRDVELIDKIPIGETLGNVSAKLVCDLNLKVEYTYSYEDEYGTNVTSNETLKFDAGGVRPSLDGSVGMNISFPAIGFSVPWKCKTVGGSGGFGDSSPYDSDGTIGKNPTVVKSYINVTDKYGENNAKYCNARISYLHYKKDGNESSDVVDMSDNDQSEYGRYNPYLVLEANRPASGICFYVLYFLDCLFAMFKEDGIAYDNSILMAHDDLCRLAFFTTHCKFTTDYDMGNNAPIGALRNLEQINSWLRTRNIDTELSIDDSKRTENIDSVTIDGTEYKVNGHIDVVVQEAGKTDEDGNVSWHPVHYDGYVRKIYYEVSNIALGITADPMTMYASSLNFPDADAKSVLDSLWASFGIRFFIDQNTRLVKPMFIRDILRSKEEAIIFPCHVVTSVKKTEKVTGFRMQYSGQSDKQQRQDNITLGSRDYDTVYDYEDYRHLNISLTYDSIIHQGYDTNMTCYVDFNTGNLYRVKVDGDATKRDEYHPVIFEVGQLHGVEIGDCSNQNKDYIEEITSSFQPVIFNDVNYRNERKSSGDVIYDMKDDKGQNNKVIFQTVYSKEQILAAFINEDMLAENVQRTLIFPLGNSHIQINLTASSRTTESFDVESSDDGDSPLQSLDWGLAVALMRGGGSSAHLDYYDYNYDMFGNCKYRMVAGSDYGISLDSIDNYAQVYDYNGDLPGIGGGSGGSFDGVYSRDEARTILRVYFPGSNYDLLNGSAWLGTTSLVDYDGRTRYYVFAKTTDATRDYFTALQGAARQNNQSIFSIDASSSRIMVASYNTQNEVDYYEAVISQLLDIVRGSASSGTVSVPVPDGVQVSFGAYDDNRISLKIRSYIEAPTDMEGPNGQFIPKGTPLCDPKVMNRGLYDQFMSDYAYLRLHGKIVEIEILCEAAALTGIQWHRRYRFGDYVGWINKIKTHITAQHGIESIIVELIVL